MNSYDIIADAVREYHELQIKNNRPICNTYIVHFYQSYKPVTGFEECTEIVFYNSDDDTCEFQSDFCEGQSFVSDISIMSIDEIGNVISRLCNRIEGE